MKLWIFCLLLSHAICYEPSPRGDLAIVILGGEYSDGPLDTVEVLTTLQGWCPQDKIKIPKLPLPGSGLTAHYGKYSDDMGGFLVVCGFTGEHACYHTSPNNGWTEWRPVVDHYGDIDLTQYDYISSTDSHQRRGISGLFKRKSDGIFRLLWNPMAFLGLEDENGMTGWMSYDLPGAEVVSYAPLLEDPYGVCFGSFVMPNGMPCAQALSGGQLFGETTSNISLWFTGCYGFDDTVDWNLSETPSLEPRSYHHCRKYDYFDTQGLVLVGGLKDGKPLSSVEFLMSEHPHHTLGAASFLPSMNEARAHFGLVQFTASSSGTDNNPNHPEYMVALGGVGADGNILSSVEIFEDPGAFPYAPNWFLKPDWEMPSPRKLFAAVANGADSLIDRYEFCETF